METEVPLRKRLDELAESSRYNSAEFWARPIATIETTAAPNASGSLRVQRLLADEHDPPQLSQQTDGSQSSFGLSRTLICGIAVVLALGLSALAYFFFGSPSEKTTTHTAELAPAVLYPPATPAAAAPSAAPTEAAPSVAPAAAAPSAAPAAATPSATRAEAAPSAAPAAESVQASPKVAQSSDVLYLQRPGVNMRSTASPTGSAIGTAPKGTRFKVTNRQGDWIQVENGRLKGWVNAGFLAPSEPR